MGCSTCSNGSPEGCGNKGHCLTGGCNKRNTFDWFTIMDIPSYGPTSLYEVSFKNGASKGFYTVEEFGDFNRGELVVVEAKNGYDVGQISLSGELVKIQMKNKRHQEDAKLPKILRKAHERDVSRLQEARGLERDTLIRARAMIKTMGLDMKLGDVQFQADKRKATFYYTAEGRVDFRELVRALAGEFRVKIEMRQIGSRQESARIGGIGSCGRELCCSTWLSEFKSVSTAAARYQNLAINQAKLSGQCGRLKCCLNYELDSYMEVLEEFPKKADVLKLKDGKATLVKMDIFKRLMYYSVPTLRGRNTLVAVPVDRVIEIQALNKQGEFPANIVEASMDNEDENKEIEFADDVTGVIDLPEIRKKPRRKNRRKKGRSSKSNPSNQNREGSSQNKTKNSRNKRNSRRNNKPNNNKEK